MLIEIVNQIVKAIQMSRERFGISYIAVLREHLQVLAPAVARLGGH